MMHDVEEKLRDLSGVLGRQAQALKMMYLFETDPEARRVIESQINLLHDKHFTYESIRFLPPPASVAVGDYPLGEVVFNSKALYSFGLREGELSQHVLIAGRSGSGKSNTMLLLAHDFIERSKPFLLFSFKREYRDLLGPNPDLLLFTAGRDPAPFAFNPLKVPHGTDRDTWVNLLAEAIATTYFLGEGAISLIRKGLVEVYEEHAQPRMIHLKEWLDKIHHSQRRELDWLASTKRSIEAMCFGPLGRVLNSDSPIALASLLEKQAVLELDNFNDDDRTFVIQCVLRWMYRYALENFPRNDCKYVLMVDEAHHVFLKRHSDVQGKETYSDAMLRMVRECSVSVVLADQHPSLISLPALGNTFTTIALNLKTQADVNAIGNAMLLTLEQKDWLGKLPVGEAIVKLQDRFVEPFQIRIPRVELERGLVTDSSIAEKMGAYFGTLSRVSMAETAETGRVAQVPLPDEQAAPATAERTESVAGELSELERAFLVSVLEHPFMGTSARYSTLQVSTRHGHATKDSLIGRGFITPVDIHIHQNKMLLFDLTLDGKDWLRSHGYTVREDKHEGGVEHRFTVWQVKKSFREDGFTVQEEKRMQSGHFVDLVASKDELVVAVEIETGKSDVLKNVTACLDEYSVVQVVATSEEALQICRRVLASLAVPESKHLEITYLLPHIQTHQPVAAL